MQYMRLTTFQYKHLRAEIHIYNDHHKQKHILDCSFLPQTTDRRPQPYRFSTPEIRTISICSVSIASIVKRGHDSTGLFNLPPTWNISIWHQHDGIWHSHISTYTLHITASHHDASAAMCAKSVHYQSQRPYAYLPRALSSRLAFDCFFFWRPDVTLHT